MFSRIKKLWKLAGNKDILPEHVEAFSKAEKAEFLADMTAEEALVYQKEEERGWGEVFQKIRSIINAGPTNPQE